MKEIIAFIAYMVVAVAIAYWVFLHIPLKRWISEYYKIFCTYRPTQNGRFFIHKSALLLKIVYIRIHTNFIRVQNNKRELFL